jgi:hypothetical protein
MESFLLAVIQVEFDVVASFVEVEHRASELPRPQAGSKSRKVLTLETPPKA